MKKIFFVLAVCLFVLAASHARAQGLPDTGQTKCYDSDAEITCPQPGEAFYGQDAEYVKTRSYTDLGNGIVRDDVTGLEWQQAISPYNMNWYQAFDYCANLELGPYSDWRLPTTQELASLVDSSRYDPAIDPIFSAGAAGYWSSNPCHVTFTQGSVMCFDVSYAYHVRAVRGNPLPANNFIDNGDGTITATATGLMWQKATAPGQYLWQQAIAYCENLDLAGYSDWRLPDRNELQSLVDYSLADSSASINRTYFTDGTRGEPFWSSTTSADGYGAEWFSDAWFVYLDQGRVDNGYPMFTPGKRSLAVSVRAVRGGQYVLSGDLGDLCIEDYHCDAGEVCDEGVCDCTENWQCATGSGCVEGACVVDAPPVITAGPFLAAYNWPGLPTSATNNFYLDQNYFVLWAFTDDYATCDGLCSHRARYQKIGETTWKYLAPQTDGTGKKYAYVELPVDRMTDGSYKFMFDLFDCAGQLKTSKTYYFNVAR